MNVTVYSNTSKVEVITSSQSTQKFTTVYSENMTSSRENVTRVLHEISATYSLNETGNDELQKNINNDSSKMYNSSQTSDSLFSHYPEPLLHFAAVCFIVFAIVGAIGNFTSILALSMNRKTRNATTAFIVNLCVADFLFCSFPMPISAMTFIEKGWNYGNALCILFPFVRYSNGAVSLFSVISITVNRYVLIGHPKIYEAIYTKRNIAIMIGLMWMFSIVFLLPPYLGVWGKLGYDPKVGTCTILAVNDKSPKILFFFAAFLFPSIVFIVCYSKIYFIVRKGSKKAKRKEDKLSSSVPKRGIANKSSGLIDLGLSYLQHRNKKELKVLQVMLVVFVLYILCYFPAFFVKVFKKECELPVLNILGYFGVYFSNIINPLIYIVMSDVYRKAYRELFFGRTSNDSHYSASAKHYVSQCKSENREQQKHILFSLFNKVT